MEPPSNSCDSLGEAPRSPSIADTHLPQHRQTRYRNLNADSDCKAGELGNNQPTAGSPPWQRPLPERNPGKDPLTIGPSANREVVGSSARRALAETPSIGAFADTHRFLARGKRIVLNRSTDPSACRPGTGKQDQYGTHAPKGFLFEPPSNSCDSLGEAPRSPSIADTHLPKHRQARYRNLDADGESEAEKPENIQRTAGNPALSQRFLPAENPKKDPPTIRPPANREVVGSSPRRALADAHGSGPSRTPNDCWPGERAFADTHRLLAQGKQTVLSRSADPSECPTGTGNQNQYGTHTPKGFLLEPAGNSCDSLSEASRSTSIADTHSFIALSGPISTQTPIDSWNGKSVPFSTERSSERGPLAGTGRM